MHTALHNTSAHGYELVIFKPEISGKPEEDPEVHIPRKVDWMDTYNLAAGERVQRFPSPLLGEAQLGYQFKHAFQGNWVELKEIFKTKFSKIGNTREMLFHTWRSFHFDEN